MLKTQRIVKEKEMIIAHEESSWRSSDGLNLFSQTWHARGKQKAVVSIIHGLNDHSTRYDLWAGKLASSGFTVRCFDLRGHGQSEGRRGFCQDISHLFSDIDDFVKKGQSLYPDTPSFLYGHSLGGNLLINYASRNNLVVNGIIVTSPWFELVKQYSKWQVFSATLISEIMPWLMVKNDLRAEDISRDLRVVHNYRNDKYSFKKINVRFALQCIQAGHKASLSIYKINVPLLVMHGTGDRITSFKASRNFVRNAGERTTFIEWSGCYHELHNDIDRDKVFDALVSWLELYTEKRN